MLEVLIIKLMLGIETDQVIWLYSSTHCFDIWANSKPWMESLCEFIVIVTLWEYQWQTFRANGKFGIRRSERNDWMPFDKKARIHQSTQNEQRPEKKLLFRRIPTLSGIVLFTTLYHLIVKTSLLSTFRSLLGCIYLYTLY